MPDVKLVVVYPRPKDVDHFEKIYQNEHVPLAIAKLGGKTKIVATKILVPLVSTVLPKFTFRRCKLWKHARRLKAAKRRSLTP
jgi:hypothetical protein